MSDRTPRVSRRTLLKVSGLAPITALVAGGATNAEIASAAACFTNIDNPAAHVLEKARDLAKKEKFELVEPLLSEVVWLLWLNFVAGTKQSGSPIENEVAIIERAYIMQTNDSPKINSGDKIVRSLGLWKQEDFDVAAATNWCAYRVGLEAGLQAKGIPITVVHFATAWQIVADDTKGLFEKWERQNRKKNEDKPLRFMGVGC